MRIPDAFFSGLGQQTAQPVAEPRPDSSADVAIGQTGGGVGQALAGIGEQQNEMQGRIDLHRAEQQAHELKQQAKLAEHSAAKSAYFNIENQFSNLHQQIVDDPEVAPEDYPAEFRKRAADLVAPLKDQLNPTQWYTIGPDVQNRVNQGAEQMFKQGQQEINDGAWADDLQAAEALVNNPAQSAKDKIQILSDPNFFADTGQPLHVIQEQKQRLIDKAIDNEVVTALNNTKGNVPALQQFRDSLRAQGDDGQYSYMPDMEIKTRERYVDLAQSAIRSAEAQARQAEAEARRNRLENARAAFDIYKDAKESLAPLSTQQESNWLAAMQGTPYYDRAKQIQKQTTSIGFILDKIKQDPLTFGAAQMGLQVPPLDPRNVAEWPQQLAQRGQVAAQIQQKNGLSFLPLLTNQEAKGIADMAGQQSPQGLVRMFDQLSTLPGMTAATMNQMARQFAATDPNLGMVVGLAGNGRDAAALQVANGQKIMADKGVKFDATGKTPGALDGRAMNERFQGLMGDALADNPQMRTTLGSAVNAAYVSLAAQNGKLDTAMDKGTFDAAFKSVVGDTAKINGKRVVIPSGMGEGTFKDFFSNLSGDTVKQYGGVQGYQTPDAAADAIRSKGQLWEMGEGRYRVTIGGRYLQTPKGQDFTLSLGSHW
ncbi:MAG TPA: hypothetical protein VI298_08715 [Geobacteraceae bacterium]